VGGAKVKTNPAESAIRERMSAGALSLEGFLGSDSRTIEEIIAEDAAKLEAAGASRVELGAFLQKIHEAADAGLETEVSLFDGRLTVQMHEGMGRIPCPFACGKVCHKGIIHVRCDKEELLLTPLQIHMIAEHGFFQGKGSPFRLEPTVLVKMM
jgi:hypothetical protein